MNAAEMRQMFCKQVIVIAYYIHEADKLISFRAEFSLHLLKQSHCFLIAPDQDRIETNFMRMNLIDDRGWQDKPEGGSQQKMQAEQSKKCMVIGFVIDDGVVEKQSKENNQYADYSNV